MSLILVRLGSGTGTSSVTTISKVFPALLSSRTQRPGSHLPVLRHRNNSRSRRQTATRLSPPVRVLSNIPRRCRTTTHRTLRTSTTARLTAPATPFLSRSSSILQCSKDLPARSPLPHLRRSKPRAPLHRSRLTPRASTHSSTRRARTAISITSMVMVRE